MQYFVCMIEDARSLSTGCKANPHVMNFIELLQRTRFYFAITFANILGNSSLSLAQCNRHYFFTAHHVSKYYVLTHDSNILKESGNVPDFNCKHLA